MNPHVTVQVEHADALAFPADLLVLKYAQALYGVDRLAVERLNLGPKRLPREGSHILIRGRALGAREVLFLGVPSLERFAYREIRLFARRALTVAETLLPQPRTIALTLHGPGYGLDEAEAFESELAGVMDAVREGSFPESLRTVTFVESDRRRAIRMRAILDGTFPDSVLGPDRTETAGSRTAERLRSVGYDSDSKEHAFVAMPFDDSFQDAFHYGIAPAIRKAGLICERIDQLSFTGDIVLRLKERISNARLVVADLTDANPNVYLEVGYAWGRDVPTVLICNEATDLNFDVRGHRCLFYRSIRDLEQKLTAEINNLRRTGT